MSSEARFVLDEQPAAPLPAVLIIGALSVVAWGAVIAVGMLLWSLF
jgi:hypothetical protein